jgi:hypothetical protein
VLGGADLDGIVASACSLQPSSVELLCDGRIVECKRDERPADVYHAYRQGHSVRVKGVQRLWPPLWQLCRRLQQDFGFPVKANLYCTPANSRGTLQHYDCHDVFVIQVAGVEGGEPQIVERDSLRQLVAARAPGATPREAARAARRNESRARGST